MTTVILAEKPSQAKAYAAAFRNTKAKDGYIEVNDDQFFPSPAYITYGFGHLTQLVEPSHYKQEWKQWKLTTLPILPDQYKFEVPKDKRKQFSIVKNLLKQASEIIVATDPDREGENIARSIIQLAGQSRKPTKRLWINSLEVEAIKQGFQHLQDGKSYLSLYEEAQTRQIGDWLVGMNGSRLYSLLLQKKGIRESFSIGRVQTPTLFMIYQRKKEIDEFTPVPFYELLADVKVQEGQFQAKYPKQFKNKEDLHQIIKNHQLEKENDAIIEKLQKTKKKMGSPKLHSLSTLQTKANKVWGISPSQVLKMMQSLYEKKLLSYPRTDTQHITPSEFSYLKENLTSYQQLANQSFEPTYLHARKKFVDSSKVQEHYAIIPTKKIPTKAVIDRLSDREKKIYFEVVHTTLAMFHDDYHFEETKVDVNIHDLIFKATGKVDIKRGWKELFGKEKASKQDKQTPKLPVIHQGENCTASLKTKEDMTKPPKPYTEGQLITMMKTAGKMIEDEVAQETLKETEGIGTEATRANIIETLKNQNYISVTKNSVTITPKGIILCQAVDETLLASPEMTAKWEQFLKKIGQGDGQQKTLLKSIEKFLYHLISQAPKDIDSRPLDTAIQQAQIKEELALCPSCKKGSIIDKGKVYGCSQYKEGCQFVIPKRFLGKSISATNAKKLLAGKKTSLIKGMKGKSKKPFNAYLKLKDGKLEFEFAQKRKRSSASS
ncbi:DNA topoisomerase 3 [Halobacillus rhizosphaerae]|uniref:type IA DNA topoisomerase n=1 Tax=Halobacillus rhizosphaerae TaxID=3064889 RepID=UPI00398B36C3